MKPKLRSRCAPTVEDTRIWLVISNRLCIKYGICAMWDCAEIADRHDADFMLMLSRRKKWRLAAAHRLERTLQCHHKWVPRS